MTQHLGFIARGRSPQVNGHASELIEDRFEVKSAAQECARLMDEAGFTEIVCGERLIRQDRWGCDEPEAIEPIEWMVHMVGAR